MERKGFELLVSCGALIVDPMELRLLGGYAQRDLSDIGSHSSILVAVSKSQRLSSFLFHLILPNLSLCI